jgi:hypothetical protein
MIGKGVEYQIPFGAYYSIGFSESATYLPIVQVLHDVQHEHPLEHFIFNRERRCVGLTEGNPVSVSFGGDFKGSSGQPQTGRRIIYPHYLCPSPGSVEHDFPATASHVQYPHPWP